MPVVPTIVTNSLLPRSSLFNKVRWLKELEREREREGGRERERARERERERGTVVLNLIT